MRKRKIVAYRPQQQGYGSTKHGSIMWWRSQMHGSLIVSGVGDEDNETTYFWLKIRHSPKKWPKRAKTKNT